MKAKPTITKEQVAAVEAMIDLLHSQNEEFYRNHPEKEHRVPDSALDELRYKLLKHLLEMRRR